MMLGVIEVDPPFADRLENQRVVAPFLPFHNPGQVTDPIFELLQDGFPVVFPSQILVEGHLIQLAGLVDERIHLRAFAPAGICPAGCEGRVVLERLRKIQQQREAARLSSHSLSPLYLVLESAHRFLDLTGTLEALQGSADETMSALIDLLEEEEAEESLLIVLEAVLDELESFLDVAAPGEDRVQQLVAALEGLQGQLSQFDLAAVYQRVLIRREEEALLREICGEVWEEELELGYLGQVTRRLDEVLHRQGCPEEVRQFLEELLVKMTASQESYEKTPLRTEEWSLEVALADRFMRQGFELWLSGLAGLCYSCGPPPDEPAMLEWLENLREGNRNWILVDRLAGL